MPNEDHEVLVERRGAARWIVINRPESRNAVNESVLSRIRTAVLEANDDPGLRAVVLTGVGDRAFCAGADIRAEGSASPVKPDMAAPHNALTQVFRAFEACNLPILARVNGHVLAGGMGLLCGCDLAIASETAKFGVPEVKVGLFPMQILGYMLRLVPRRKLMEMCMTGDPFTAAEALEMGLVNHVVPADRLDEKVEWLLGRILKRSPTALRHGKNGLHALQDMPLHQAFAFAEANVARMSMTEDAREGFAAFQEKRDPDWPGR